MSAPRPPATAGDVPRPASARVVHVVAAAVGVVALVGAGVSAAATTATSALREDVVLTADAAGVSALDVDVTAGELRVVAGAPGTDVVLDVRGARRAWALERDGATVAVVPPPSPSGWGIGRLDDLRAQGVATLTVPADLGGGAPDLDVDVTDGVAVLHGSFGTLDVGATGGSVDLTGTVADLTVEVTGGDVDAAVSDVATADVRTTAGTVVLELDGTPPDAVTVDARAGSVDVSLPPSTYDVRTDAEAGEVSDALRSSTSSPRTVEATVAAGLVTLRESAPR